VEAAAGSHAAGDKSMQQIAVAVGAGRATLYRHTQASRRGRTEVHDDTTGAAEPWPMLALGVLVLAGCGLWVRRTWRLRQDRPAADSFRDCALMVLIVFIYGAFPVMIGALGLVGEQAPEPAADVFVWSMLAALLGVAAAAVVFRLRDTVVARRRDRALGRPRAQWLVPAWGLGVVWGAAALVLFVATVYLVLYAFAWYAISYAPTITQSEFNTLAVPVVLIPAGLVWLTIAALGVRAVLRRRRRIRQREEDLRRRWLGDPDEVGEA
jgi:hypothetical protein